MESSSFVGDFASFDVVWVTCCHPAAMSGILPMECDAIHSHNSAAAALDVGGVGAHRRCRCTEPGSDNTHRTGLNALSPCACRNGSARDLASPFVLVEGEQENVDLSNGVAAELCESGTTFGRSMIQSLADVGATPVGLEPFSFAISSAL